MDPMNRKEPVHCSECDFVHQMTRNDARPWDWRCVQFPAPLGHGFVAPKYSPEPPYEKCERANPFGNCNRFTPLREAPQP